MADQDRGAYGEERVTSGDTGAGQTDVPADEQGISNRPGDQETDDDNEDDLDDDDDPDAVTRDEQGELS